MTLGRIHILSISLLCAEVFQVLPAAASASEREIGKPFSEEPLAVEPATQKTLSAVIEKLVGKKIVYVGEEHDKFSHHQVQLEILRALYQGDPRIAVGMEMFQRPFQKALDDYIAGVIDERAFLKQSEYFKRWSLDYNHYKSIVDFAREKRLPVIALNLRREIVEKAGKEGLQSLSPVEKRQIPAELDFSDPDYRARLKETFAQHPRSEEKQFEFFYQAQILWDETMAESIHWFLQKNSEFRLLVIAGNGHLEYGAGIPKRSFRRNQFDYAIVLNDGKVKKGIADFIVFPETSEGPTAPRLKVTLSEKNQGVYITEFAKDSAAERAGLKVGDVIKALDDQQISGVDDLRIHLFYKRPGETIEVKAKRGDEELKFDVTLP